MKKIVIISIVLFIALCTVYVFIDRKNKSSINIENYPKLINETDDTGRIQRAINASVGSKLRFQEGVYIIGKTIHLPSDIEIDFNSSTIIRKSGLPAFDMLINANPVKGNDNLVLKNLIIDGNKDADSFVATSVSDRFSGLKLVKVKNSKLDNVTVKRTVNGEDQGDNKELRPAAGIYFVNSFNIDCNNINGYNNDRTAIFINKSKVKINGSTTYNNLGSGISSTDADESEYHNVVSYNNGYSNISVNGVRSKVSSVVTYNSKYSGLNIGHDGVPSDDTVVWNIHSYNNAYEGLTIGGSARVRVDNIEVYGNHRNNIRVFNKSTASKIYNVISRDSIGGAGIKYDSGKGHSLKKANIFNNALNDIEISKGVSVQLKS
ncbi:right-handed parallel beta-helix repeat-containing protein [Bacillus mycoides]|uniref:right-handed parallel beta-helix repeat-containing protein n=1 Tax=Bacillus mycoides TaxID=1405 RepID=UPI001C00D779|nr:right-handed parallel beta-helix repeat-containing protein [Bacillus mycoides]QWG33370.1 hypothetical protein EXW30_10730 [Bacillus mycoides]